MTAGRLQRTSQPLLVWISDKCLTQYVMYICFTAYLLNLHPTLAFQHPSRHWTDSSEAVNAMFMVTELQWAARFSSGWFAARLCTAAEQAEEQQGRVRGAQPLVITSISATAPGWGWGGGRVEKLKCASLEVSPGQRWQRKRQNDSCNHTHHLCLAPSWLKQESRAHAFLKNMKAREESGEVKWSQNMPAVVRWYWFPVAYSSVASGNWIIVRLCLFFKTLKLKYSPAPNRCTASIYVHSFSLKYYFHKFSKKQSHNFCKIQKVLSNQFDHSINTWPI